MSFLYPYVLWGLVLPLLVAAAAILRHRCARAAWRKLISRAHEPQLVTRRAPWHRLCSGVFGLLALTLLVIALARPINGYREASATATSRNLLIALDISRSMETQDVKPSRLEEARAAAYELIGALPEDKIGLIVFSGEADLVVPLTYDHTALRDALAQVDRSWAAAGGTNFNKVLRKAMQDFERSAPNGTNALVILSDGEDTTDNRTDITEEAKKNHLLVITVGIGTAAGGAIPDPEGDNGLWQDADGKHVISKLDEDSLQRLATATGGDYFRMSGHSDLTDFARRSVRKLACHEEEFSVNKVPNDLYSPFAAAALLLLVASILCGTDWRLPRRGLPLFALLAFLCAGQAQALVRKSSLQHYREGINSKRSHADEAKEHFSRALLDANPKLQAAALCGIGNINTQATLEKLKGLYTPAESPDDAPESTQQQGPSVEQLRAIVAELKEDITSYEAALKLNPTLRPAALNKAGTEKLIRRLEEEIKRLEQQQNQPQQDHQDDRNDQETQDNQDNPDQEQDDRNDDKQDEQEQENPQDSQQDKNDNRDEQQDDNQNQQNDPQQNPQDENDKQDEQQNPQNQQQEQQGQEEPPAPEQATENEKEKAEQRAAAILQMHIDEEEGSPIPHRELPAQQPKKDY